MCGLSWQDGIWAGGLVWTAVAIEESVMVGGE